MPEQPQGLIIEPRDTLVIRDGRELEGTNVMRNLPFPWPSTVAGCVRGALGPLGPGDTWADNLKVEVAGPWLTELDAQTYAVKGLLFRAPRDCFWVRPVVPEGATPKPPRRWRLRPSPATVTCNLPAGLQLVTPDWGGGPVQKGKPPKDVPQWWSADALYAWLATPKTGEVFDTEALKELGPHKPMPTELRTHVRIDSKNRTAADSDLFSTQGARFADTQTRHAIGAAVFDGQHAQTLAGRRLVKLGGEGRISRLRTGAATWPDFGKLRAALSGATTVRAMLITPGLFSAGALPDAERIKALFGDDARLMAACVDRPEVISGWDMATRGPKPTRRMAPAGSVYWITGVDSARLADAWMASLCDDAQDQLDGFGRMLLGVA